MFHFKRRWLASRCYWGWAGRKAGGQIIAGPSHDEKPPKCSFLEGKSFYLKRIQVGQTWVNLPISLVLGVPLWTENTWLLFLCHQTFQVPQLEVLTYISCM